MLEYAVFIATTNPMTFSRPTKWETKTPEEIVEDLKLVRTMAMYEGDELVKRLEANDLMVFDELHWRNLKPDSGKRYEKKSKGEKKRQRSEWNNQMRGYRK